LIGSANTRAVIETNPTDERTNGRTDNFRVARHSGTTRVWATLGFKGKVFRTPLAPIHSYEFQV
jgi:hypothetical protein